MWPWCIVCLFRRPRLVLRIGLVSEQLAGLSYPPQRVPRNWKGWPKGELMGALTMTDSQQSVLTVSAVDKKGNPTAVTPGSIAWLVDNPALLSITDNGDGTATLKAVGPIGTGVVTVKATVNGADVAGTLDVTIVSGAPTQLTVTAGTPTEQP